MHRIIFHHPACEIIVENKGKTDLNHTTEEQETSVFPLPAPVLLMELFFLSCTVENGQINQISDIISSLSSL